MNAKLAATRAVLLRSRGLVFAEPGSDENPEEHLRALELELAQLGYLPSSRLRACLKRLPAAELAELQGWLVQTLAEKLGADQKHTPLFRKFPDDIPDDTYELWVRKVLCHFLQAPDQACLFCQRNGTTHVLSPCQHVVCDHCFDGSNYSACPVCEHHVDTSSPFFQAAAFEPRGLPKERVRFKLLDLCDSVDVEARALFESYCARTQAMSPADKDDLAALLGDYGERVLPWLPETIPVKENVAAIFGALFKLCQPDQVLPAAKQHLSTATDVLRFIAAFSGADPALQRETQFKVFDKLEGPSRFWGKVAKLLGADPPGPRLRKVTIPIRVNRFKVAPLRRPLRRALLALLEGFEPDLLIEDMLRHRSYWVWVGEFLHPAEYRKRFPNVARAFAVVRGKGPDGKPAPAFQTYYSKLEAAAAGGDAAAMTALLKQRPGELARRFDHALRVAGDNAVVSGQLVEAFVDKVAQFSTPVLLTLHSLLPTRLKRAPIRIYWPKGGVAKGVSAPDARPSLRADAVRPAVAAIEAELLRRFGDKPAFETCLIDEPLADVMVPFNERTASRAAVSLPRGSHVAVPEAKIVRLFLHWCEPEKNGHTTDLDLSVGFYGADWSYRGVCSYYELKLADARKRIIAQSAGDLQSAPYPDGATEFVDLHREVAHENGIRYAVMVVNAYAGMPFSQLERGFAGIMLRDDVYGDHFDPRTVELKFALQGENGVFLPLVLDLEHKRLHWLDTYSKGQFQLNNVKTSNADIQRICPEMITYFDSGVRCSMYRLGLLHAAARCRRVLLRGKGVRRFERAADESATAFFERLQEGVGETGGAVLPGADDRAILALLFRGDLELAKDSEVYALFPDLIAGNLAAVDLLS